MTRVTIASYDDDPPLGGQGVVVHGMRAALERRGVRVHTISGRGEHAIAFARRTGRAPLDFSMQLNRYPQILLRAAPDVIHAQGGPGGVLLWKRLGAPLVYTAHHTYRQAHARGSVKRLLDGVEARCYRAAAMVLPVSRSNRQRTAGLRDSPHPASRCSRTVSDTVELEPRRRSPEDKQGAFVSAVGTREGECSTQSQCSGARGAVPGCAGVLVGWGSLAGEVRRCRRAASGGRVEYLGALDREALHREYARAAVARCRRASRAGMDALEAQAAGTPVVGFDVDGLRGRRWWLAAYSSPAGYASALRDA